MAIGGKVARRAGTDTIAAPHARVVLHGVSRQTSGKLDSTATDEAGAFRFRISRDTSMVYLLSANWSGIEYFSEPIPGSSLDRTATLTLLVADTSSARAAETGGRFIVLGSPGATRDRRAVDLFVIRNRGDHTIVGAGGIGATWRAPLPRGVTGARMGSAGSEISADAVRFAGDSIAVIAPIAPGEKQLLVEYTIPESMSRLELEAVTLDTIQIVAEEQGVTVAGLEKTADQVLDGRPFARWHGRGVSLVTISFPVAAARDRALIPLVIAAAVIAVLVGVLAMRFRPARVSAPPLTSEALLTRIAALDADHAGRALGDDEKSRYDRERAELKRALTELLRREGLRGL
ncbi:MAG TPA: hypothetical protein VJU15_10115 [Gemmatimonadales bacterium]|nr:hypothetical protein [Gemmatimonadales bacterium]